MKLPGALEGDAREGLRTSALVAGGALAGALAHWADGWWLVALFVVATGVVDVVFALLAPEKMG